MRNHIKYIPLASPGDVRSSPLIDDTSNVSRHLGKRPVGYLPIPRVLTRIETEGVTPQWARYIGNHISQHWPLDPEAYHSHKASCSQSDTRSANTYHFAARI